MSLKSRMVQRYYYKCDNCGACTEWFITPLVALWSAKSQGWYAPLGTDAAYCPKCAPQEGAK